MKYDIWVKKISYHIWFHPKISLSSKYLIVSKTLDGVTRVGAKNISLSSKYLLISKMSHCHHNILLSAKYLIVIKISHYQQNISLSSKYLIISKTLGGVTRVGAKSWISATCHTQGSFLLNDNSDENKKNKILIF